MRLQKIQDYFKEKEWDYEYNEEDGLGSIDFDYRGVAYHIWEFEGGAESNVRNGGRQEDFLDDYETEILALIKDFQ